MGDVLRAVAGTITTIRGLSVDAATYHGVATGLGDVWRSVNRAVEDIVDHATLADLLAARHEQPTSLTSDIAPTRAEGGWVSHEE